MPESSMTAPTMPSSTTPAAGASPFAYLLLALVLLAIAVPMTAAAYRREVDTQRTLLATVARLEADQAAAWFAERKRTGRLLAGSAPVAALYQRAVGLADATAWEALTARLEQYVADSGFSAIVLLDEHGQALWHSEGLVHDPAALERHLADAWPSDPQPGTVRPLPPYRDAGGALHIDLAIALSVSDGNPVPIAVGHADPLDLFHVGLLRWPTPSASGAMTLVADIGNEFVVVDPSHPSEAPGDASGPSGERPLPLEAAVAGGSHVEPKVLGGRDHRGVAALAAGSPIADSGWSVVARLDRSEAYAAANARLWQGALLVALAYAGVAFGTRTFVQRQTLSNTAKLRRAQDDRLEALGLLQSIVEHSDDVIFAKDLEGRYTVFNPAAARAFGRPPEQVLGRDARALFTTEKAGRLQRDEARVIAEDRVIVFDDTVETSTDGERTFAAMKGPLRDEHGRVFGVFGIARDITELRDTERRLRQQGADLRRSLDELERFNRAMVGRELTIITLKRQLNALSEELGRHPPFRLDQIDSRLWGEDA